MSNHELYTASDFTEEGLDGDRGLVKVVVESGLHVCKKCGKAESELEGPCRIDGAKK